MTIRASTSPIEACLTDASGAQQIVQFFGPEPQRFGVVHLPAGTATAGVVLCPALHSDFERTYRRDVLLSRALCERGYAVHRFHYRGLGNSQGTSSDTTLGTMREDAHLAAERLRAIGGVDRIGFAGTRWGGLVAAAAAADDEASAPLALWEPAVQADRYFREATRARAVRDAKDGKPPSTWDDLRAEMDRAGSVDVLGYAIDAELYRSAAGHGLIELLDGRPRPVLLVQMGTGRGLRPEYRRLVQTMDADGCEIETHVVEGEEHWWFIGGFWEAVETRASTRALLDVTTGWFARWMPPSNATS